jgi:putative nucleotidyltransferase with HDIG domain
MIEEQDIIQILNPFLDQIKNTDLRTKVIKTWMEGCRQGGWTTRAQLEQMPFTLATDPRGISFLEHTRAVTQGALGLADAQLNNYGDHLPYSIDRDRLIAGGLLHDIGKLLEIESDMQGGWRMSHGGKCMRHPISGVVLAQRAGVPEDILNIIACHAKEGEGRTQVVETVLVHQADFATFIPLVMMINKKLIMDGSHGTHTD